MKLLFGKIFKSVLVVGVTFVKVLLNHIEPVFLDN